MSSTVKRTFRDLCIVFLAALIIFGVFHLVSAGSLTPTSPPASTMNSLSDVYSSLVGTFDSSTITPSKNGDALQISKCIILKVNGSTPCP